MHKRDMLVFHDALPSTQIQYGSDFPQQRFRLGLRFVVGVILKDPLHIGPVRGRALLEPTE